MKKVSNMKILVYDVAAEDGGGLFVLNNFYKEVLAYNAPDVEWIFIVSTKEIAGCGNVKVLYFPEAKASWGARLKFEYIKLPGLIKKISPDLIISLQNMPVKRCDIRQFVYLHQSLQYCPKKFSLIKSEERDLAIRQKFISALIKSAMPKAEKIFVQTKWIKDATVKWLKRDSESVYIVPVCVNTEGIRIKEYRGAQSRTFFYPARAEIYKNHSLIIEACKILSDKGINDYKIVLTIRPDENAYAQSLASSAENLPIEYIGSVDYGEIWDMYSKTILLFPSYLETCGLPLLEARRAGSVILASDMPFSHEALGGYQNACFFSADDAVSLAAQMEKALEAPSYYGADGGDASPQTSLLKSMLERI